MVTRLNRIKKLKIVINDILSNEKIEMKSYPQNARYPKIEFSKRREAEQPRRGDQTHPRLDNIGYYLNAHSEINRKQNIDRQSTKL